VRGHSESIGHVSVLALDASDFLTSTTASDKAVRVWRNGTLLQDVECRVLALCSALFRYRGRVFLAVGDVTARIVIYRMEDGGFEQVAAVEGHADWIRDLDWTVGVAGEAVLASASLDRMIRLWSFTDGEAARLDVTLEAVLEGHDHSVMNAKWGPENILISTSFDKTVMIW
jgi:WD40 repeat protein